MHTKEPWIQVGSQIIAGKYGDILASCAVNPENFNLEQQLEHARRIAACVNACTGLTDAELAHGFKVKAALATLQEQIGFLQTQLEIRAQIVQHKQDNSPEVEEWLTGCPCCGSYDECGCDLQAFYSELFEQRWKTEKIANDKLRQDMLKFVEMHRKQVAQLEEDRQDLLHFILYAQVASGVCCCGDSMEGHPSEMEAGHPTIDIWDHAVLKFREKFPDVVAQIEARNIQVPTPILK